MKISVRLCVPLVMMALLTSCSTMARRLEVAPVKKIVPGETSIGEVEKVFGPPHERITGSNGKTLARYYFTEPRLNNHVDDWERRDHPGDVLFRTLTLLYGPGPVIERKLHDESVMAVHRTNARFVAGPSVLPANLKFFQARVTTKAELIDRLGEPTSTSFTVEGAPLLFWISATYRAGFVVDKELRTLVVELDDHSVIRNFSVQENDPEFLRRLMR